MALVQKAWISDDYLGSFLLSQARLQTQSWLTVIGGPSCTTKNAITDCPRLKGEFVLLRRVELPHEMQKIVSWCVCVSFFFSVFPKISLFYFRYRYTFSLHHVTLTYGCNKHIIILSFSYCGNCCWHSPNFYLSHQQAPGKLTPILQILDDGFNSLYQSVNKVSAWKYLLFLDVTLQEFGLGQ